ncbi:VapB-type antitoxin [Acidianus sp. HS-5]|uniref:VapB-type antitoxin n=1 Tax=Acidianus sp. HS-5 TaxID=2886040 RepID=UPI001F273966|nr:VapB-type antitoxin [Acidianus sp. HS-5]BDC17354.1 hypothetical protein HS5_02440 [Acidianus sp. HS-5]
MEEKIVDSKGRVYLGKWFANKKVYVINLGGLIVLTPYTVFAEELEKIQNKDDLISKDASPQEIKKSFSDHIWEKLSRYQVH